MPFGLTQDMKFEFSIHFNPDVKKKKKKHINLDVQLTCKPNEGKDVVYLVHSCLPRLRPRVENDSGSLNKE